MDALLLVQCHIIIVNDPPCSSNDISQVTFIYLSKSLLLDVDRR